MLQHRRFNFDPIAAPLDQQNPNPTCPQRWLLLALPLLLSACGGNNTLQTGGNPPPPTEQFITYQKALKNFSSELNTLYNNDSNMDVVYTGIGWAPGTVLITNNNIYATCTLPDAAFQQPDPNVNWMPGTDTSTQFSASGSLPAAIAKVVSINGSINTGESVSLDFQDMSQHVAMLSPFLQVLTSSSCGTIINNALVAGYNVSVVRGTIDGKETFDFSHAPGISLGVNIASVANFSVSGQGGGKPLTFTEQSPTTHFVVLYTIKSPVVIAAEAPNPAPAAVPLTAPANASPATPSVVPAAIAASTAAAASPIKPAANIVQSIQGTVQVQQPGT
jgi:hypothetical protein